MSTSLAVAVMAPGVDRHEVIEILLAAFRDDPAIRGLYPTDLDYVRYLPGYIMAFGGRAFDAGTVDTDREGHAAALWFPPGVAPDAAAAVNHLALSAAPGRVARLAAGLEAQAERRPEEPHWYLPWMGVVPEAQGMGIGGALLREGLERADADGLPVCLEATTRRSAAFYARHGFTTRAVTDLPGYPEITTMWRPAR
jgi:GNAT superfamily N-acetyltransferase